MNGTQTRPQQPTDWHTRCVMALSLANNEKREPARNLVLIRAALEGATLQDLFDMERLGTEAF